MKEIVLAGGCFWGIEAYFKRLDGIVASEVGYANGTIENPSYEMVCSHVTGHAEVVKLTYDTSVISLDEILARFWKIIDPTLKNRQGNDMGSQYRTGIYYIDDAELPIIESSKENEATKYNNPIVTEVVPLSVYYKAEEYHQKYLDKNPDGYCHINLDD